MSISDKESRKVAKAHRHEAGQVGVRITRSPEETRKLAAVLAKKLHPGSVVALHGDLGSGKTCFAQGLAEALGVRAIVNSPTFTIVNEYAGTYPFRHVDLYRVKSANEADSLGLENIADAAGITVIEWPEVFSALLPPSTVHVYFEFVDENRRRIRVE